MMYIYMYSHHALLIRVSLVEGRLSALKIMKALRNKVGEIIGGSPSSQTPKAPPNEDKAEEGKKSEEAEPSPDAVPKQKFEESVPPNYIVKNIREYVDLDHLLVRMEVIMKRA